MGLRVLSQEEAVQSVDMLRDALKTILMVGDHTQRDRSTRREYVNIIIEIGNLQKELKNYVNCN
jgi:hypothetical protein